jgi:hypothetical protein
MLVGHFAAGFAAKRIASRVSLGTLQTAALFPDLLVFVDQLVGIEHARTTPGITAFSSLDGYDVAISDKCVVVGACGPCVLAVASRSSRIRRRRRCRVQPLGIRLRESPPGTSARTRGSLVSRFGTMELDSDAIRC